jgi:hypothetical protein
MQLISGHFRNGPAQMFCLASRHSDFVAKHEMMQSLGRDFRAVQQKYGEGLET